MVSSQFLRRICAKADYEYQSHERLASGARSSTHRVETSDEQIVLKKENVEYDVEQEFSMLDTVDGLAPRPIQWGNHSFPWILMEYVTGEHPSDFDENFADRMASFYTELHDTTRTSKPTCRYEEMMRKTVLDRYADIRGGLPDELGSRWDVVFDNAGSALKPFTREDRVVIHSDPNPDNILFGEDTCLVDWEHARFDIPEWDIAMFLNKYEFMYEIEQPVLESFLAAYEPDVHHLDLVRLFAYLSIMNWLIERLNTVENIPSEVFASSTEEVLNMLRDDLSTAHTLLKRV